MSQQVANALKLKVEQILSRNGAGATSMYNAFVVEPQLNLLEEMSTEGLIRNVSLIKAELLCWRRMHWMVVCMVV